MKHELDTVVRMFTKAREKVVKRQSREYVSALKEKARVVELEADAEKIRECIFKLSSDESINWRLNNLSERKKSVVQ